MSTASLLYEIRDLKKYNKAYMFRKLVGLGSSAVKHLFGDKFGPSQTTVLTTHLCLVTVFQNSLSLKFKFAFFLQDYLTFPSIHPPSRPTSGSSKLLCPSDHEHAFGVTDS